MIPFSKYHGLGNDFILIETIPEALPPPIVRALCHRHFGVGADGILLLCPDDHADARMIVLNADGSRPEMCGNGLRCAAFFLAAKLHTHPTSASLTIATDAGPKDCLVHLDPPNPEATVRIDLGSVQPPSPTTVSCLQETVELITTSVGNPHAVILRPTIDFDRFAPELSSHPAFPHGTNVSFVQPHDDYLDVRVWERGAGPTLACGTAACAVAAVAVDQGLATPDQAVTIRLPGGPLQVTITQHRHAIMTGPARHVFDGTLLYEPNVPSTFVEPPG